MASQLIPPRFLFRWAFPVNYRSLSQSARSPLPLESQYALPRLENFDGTSAWIDLFVAWHESGLGIGIEVHGKSARPVCDPGNPQTSDGITLWLDTRATQNVHRATKYCHSYLVMPTGSGRQQREPGIQQLALSQAREPSGVQSTDGIQLLADVRDNGYRLDVWFPAASLYGYDPVNHTRLGFFLAVDDRELGTQTLTVGEEFPYHFDPSIWQTLELVR